MSNSNTLDLPRWLKEEPLKTRKRDEGRRKTVKFNESPLKLQNAFSEELEDLNLIIIVYCRIYKLWYIVGYSCIMCKTMKQLLQISIFLWKENKKVDKFKF